MTFKGQFLRWGSEIKWKSAVCLFPISLWSIGPYCFVGLAPNKNNWSTTYSCNLSLSLIQTSIHRTPQNTHTYIHTHTHTHARIHETHPKDPSDYSLCFNDKWRCIDKRRNCMTRVTRKLVSRSSDNKLTQDCVVVTGPASHYMIHINIHVQKNTKNKSFSKWLVMHHRRLYKMHRYLVRVHDKSIHCTQLFTSWWFDEGILLLCKV